MAVVQKEQCSGCGVCMYYCPEEAIGIDNGRKADIDPDMCADCGKCIEVCPKNAIL